MDSLPFGERGFRDAQTRPMADVIKNYTYFTEGDVLLAKITPSFENGKLGMATELVNGVGFGSSEFLVMRPQTGLLSEYLLHFLSREQFRNEGARLMTGAVGHKRVPEEFVMSQRLPLPSLDDQHRIVAKLDQAFAEIDRAIENTERTITLIDQVVDRSLVALIDRTRKYPLQRLSEVCLDFGRGRSRHRPRNAPHLYGGSYPFIQTGDVKAADHKVTSHTTTYSGEGLAQSKLWPAGTVCITIAANIAESAILEYDACFPDSIIGAVPDPHRADADYLEYMLRAFRTEIQTHGRGFAQENINLKTFEVQHFPIPPLEEQKAIVESFSAVRVQQSEIRRRYVEKLTALRALKQSILAETFSFPEVVSA